MNAFDVVVVGSGPGGYVAAIRASQLGLKTAIIEREHLGGVCLNWGCIPTKALLRSAEVKHLIDHATDFGLEVGPVKVNLDKIIQRSRQVAEQLSNGIKGLLKKNKITVLDGHGRFETSQSISVTAKDGTKQTVQAKHIILATGSTARTLPFMPENHPRVWTAKQAMIPGFMPKSLLIIGSGAIGIEFASFYRTLGVDVTVVELLDRILPQEDAEISTLAQKAFDKQGMNFMLKSSLTDLKTTDKDVTATITDQHKKTTTLTVDAVIIAVGIVGNTDNLGLEKTKIKVEKNQIVVNEWCQTAEPHIFAIGDLVSAPWLAHKASHEGVMCAEKIAGVKDIHPIKRDLIPGCTYSLPQIASVGLTEEKAKAAHRDIKVGRFPFRGNGKAIALGEPEGLIKTIFDSKTGELLGAHMIGAEVTELISTLTLAKTLEGTEAELMHTIFPHPTLSEMLHESVLDAYGKVIHF